MEKNKQDENISKENISIAEKVKFWEEQDRINKSLIPRVVKMNEIITELSSTVANYSKLFSKQEIRIKQNFDEKIREVDVLNNSLKKLSDELIILSKKNKDAIADIDDFNTKGKAKINELIEKKFNKANASINHLKDETQDSIKNLKQKNKNITIALIISFIIILFSFLF